MRRVLVATDFSEPSRIAARWACRLADGDAAFRFVHVEAADRAYAAPPVEGGPAPPAYPLAGEIHDAAERAARAQLERFVADLAGELGPRARDLVLVQGAVAREVLREARAFGADVTVVGAHGQGPVRRLLGSKARSILHAVDTDLLVGRGEAPPAAPRVLVATDFSESATAAARRARAWAGRLGGPLVVAHAMDPAAWGSWSEARAAFPGKDPEEVLGRALHAFNEAHLEGAAREVVVKGSPGAEVPRVAEETRADLLVVGTHGPGRIERMLLGSVAQAVLERAPCAVFVART